MYISSWELSRGEPRKTYGCGFHACWLMAWCVQSPHVLPEGAPQHKFCYSTTCSQIPTKLQAWNTKPKEKNLQKSGFQIATSRNQDPASVLSMFLFVGYLELEWNILNMFADESTMKLQSQLAEVFSPKSSVEAMSMPARSRRALNPSSVISSPRQLRSPMPRLKQRLRKKQRWRRRMPRRRSKKRVLVWALPRPRSPDLEFVWCQPSMQYTFPHLWYVLMFKIFRSWRTWSRRSLNARPSWRSRAWVVDSRTRTLLLSCWQLCCFHLSMAALHCHVNELLWGWRDREDGG